MDIRPFLGADAHPSELRQRYDLYAADRHSVFPGFPIQTYEQYAASARRAVAAAAIDSHGPLNACAPDRSALEPPALQWSAWQGERLVGSASVSIVDEDGMLVAVPRVEVASNHRRRGVGTALLRRLVSAAQARGCTILLADSVRIGSTGSLWAGRVGFRTTQVFSWQMLHIRDAEPTRWHVAVPDGYRIEYWTAAAPERLVAALAKARNAIADSPLGDSSLVHPMWTVERLRRIEAEIAADGDESHSVVVIHEQTGEVAAFTELLLDPRQPELSWQRDTAVVRAHRGLGLARTIKAAMLRRLTAEVPGFDRVITSTAVANTAMRRVNEQLGYVPYAEISLLEAAPAEIEARISVPGARRPREHRLREHQPLLQHLADFEA